MISLENSRSKAKTVVMRTTQLLWVYRNTLIMFITPLILLPIPLVVKDLAASCAYCVLIMAVYWVTEVIPLGVTALFPLFLFPLTGIISAADASKAFVNNVSWMFLGVLIFAIGVEETRLHKRIALKILLLVGTSPHRVMLGLMVSTSFHSLWASKIAVTAMMLPVLEAIIMELEDGGKVPVVSSKDNRLEKFRKMNTGFALCVAYSASIAGIGNPVTATNLILSSQYQIMFPNSPEQLNFVNWLGYNLPSTILILFLSYIWMAWRFFGFSKEMIPFMKTKKSDIDVKINKILTRVYNELGKLTYDETTVIIVAATGLLLWFTRDPGFMVGWSILFLPGFVTDSTVAMIMAVSLFILPDRRPSLLGGKSGPAQSILHWKLVHEKFPWQLFLLIGGSFVMALGIQTSGLGEWLGGLLKILYSLPHWTICLILTIICSVLTEFATNVSIIAVLIPIAGSMALPLGVHPLYLLIPIVTASSLAFMLPVATPTNALAYSFANLKITDLLKTGWMLNIIGIAVINFFINTYGTSFFNFDGFSDWAYASLTTTDLMNFTIPN